MARAQPPHAQPTPPPLAPAVEYRVDFTQRTRQALVVELTTRADAPLELWLPAWTPGAYELRTWARNLRPLDAHDDAGHALPFVRTGPSTFRVGAPPSPSLVHVRYRIYAPRLTDDGSHVDGAHALVNGSSVFVAVRGRERARARVTLALPAGWRAATALASDDARSDAGSDPRADRRHEAGSDRGNDRGNDLGDAAFRADSYEALIDAPIECGTFAQATARALAGAGQPERLLRVAVDGPGAPALASTLAAELAKLVEAESAFVGPPPFAGYLAIVHLADEPGRVAALEHAASTSILVPRSSGNARDDLDERIYVLAHELFHAWNARPLRPAELVPYDLLHAQPARSLWITEGLAEYYAHRTMRRRHHWSRDEYLKRVAEEAGHAAESAQAGMTLEESAEATWQPPDDAGPEIDGYYARGHLVALALDARLRVISKGAHTLDDVLRALLAEAHARGGVLTLDSDGLARAADALAPGVGDELRGWLRAANELPAVTAALATIGLKLELRVGPPLPLFGFDGERLGAGVLVTELVANGAAALAGLHLGDRIVSVDAQPLDSHAEAALAATRKPGDRVRLGVRRGARTLVLHVTTQEFREVEATLAPAPDVTPALAQLRETLLAP